MIAGLWLITYLSYAFFVLIMGFIVYFLFIRGKLGKKKADDEEVEETRPRRRHLLPERTHVREQVQDSDEAPDSDSEPAGSEEEGGDDENKLSKREMNKLLKKKEKEERRREMEHAREEQETRMAQKQQYHSEKQKKREEERLAHEAEEKKVEEEQKKKEAEEYDKWKIGFAVEQAGAEAEEDKSESQSKLASFIHYITSRKVVPLNDVAAEFSMATASVIDRIKALEQDGRLSGIMDDRGKYIYISPEEFKVFLGLIRG